MLFTETGLHKNQVLSFPRRRESIKIINNKRIDSRLRGKDMKLEWCLKKPYKKG